MASRGGKQIILTCRACNNAAGYGIAAEAARRYEAAQFASNALRKARQGSSWNINEYRLPEKRVSTLALVGPSATNPYLGSLLLMLNSHWAAENGYAIRMP